MAGACWSVLAMGGWGNCAWGEPFVVLETVGAGGSAVVTEEVALAEYPACPASTFKLVITLAALEGGIATPATRHRCADAKGGPDSGEIDMREAMRESSNEYFLWLARRLGSGPIADWAWRTGFFGEVPPEGWVGDDPSAVVRGGVLKVTPRRLHDFTVRLMRGRLTTRPEVQGMLEEVMAWPSPDPGTRVFCKTGAWGGAAWCTGFVERTGSSNAVTVLVPYRVPDWRPARSMAIEAFYARAGLAPPGC